MNTKALVGSLAILMPSLALAQTSLGRFVDLGSFGGAYIGRGNVAEHGARTLLHVSQLQVALWAHDDGPSVLMPPGPPPTLGSSAYGPAMDAHGEVYAYASVPAGGGAQDVRAQRWSAALGLLPLPAPAGGTGVATTQAVSGDGQFVLGSFEHPGFNLSSDPITACRWDSSGQPEPLGELPGGEDSGYALAASYDESIVVGNCSVEIQVDMLGNSWSVEGGFVWTNAAGMQAIAQPAKDFLARGISADGAVIFGSGLGPASGQPSVALRRVSGQPIEELLLPQGTSYCLASNQNGSVILGQAQNSIVWGHSSYTGAFLWRAGQGAVALEDALLAAGVNLPSGFTLTRAITLAPTGDAVLGLGRDAQNVEHAYLAYLVAPALEVGTHGCDPGQANSTGGPATLRALGYGYLSGPGLALSVEGLPPGVTCLLLASRAPGLVPLPGGSEGELCLGGSIGRFGAPQEIQQADSFGQAELSLDFASLPQPTGRVAILAGETWYFQAWYRDSNPTMTSNFSSTTAHLFVP